MGHNRRGRATKPTVAQLRTDAIGSTLRLMSDYGCGVPLWGDRECLAGPRTDLGLSATLYDDLLAWQEHFERHFHYQDGWDSAAEATAYGDQGRELLARLRRELPGRDVRLDLWPIDGLDGDG